MSMSSASTTFLSGGGGSLPFLRGGASVGRSRRGGTGGVVEAPVTTPAVVSGRSAAGSPSFARNRAGGGGGISGFDAPPFGGSAIDDPAQYTLVRVMRL